MAKNTEIKTFSIDRRLSERLKKLTTYFNEVLEQRIDLSRRVNESLAQQEENIWKQSFEEARERGLTKTKTLTSFKKEVLNRE